MSSDVPTGRDPIEIRQLARSYTRGILYQKRYESYCLGVIGECRKIFTSDGFKRAFDTAAVCRVNTQSADDDELITF